MAQVNVTLIRADTNQEFDVELPDDAPITELLPALVKELGLPITGPDGNQVAYELSNKRTAREYKEDDTLGGASTKTGDSLLLTSTFVAGTTHATRQAWDNFGKPVTSTRLTTGERQLKEMLPDAGSQLRLGILGFFRERVERDEPAVLLGADPPAPIDALDLTGRYRLLAALLA